MSGPGARAGLRPFRPVSFGRFTLLAPLAAGGMGEIYLARSTFQGGLEKLCVIKKVLPQLAEDPEFVGRFLDEARTLVALQHGSIAQVYDTGSFDSDYWIAMEFVDGKDLRRLMQRVRSNGSRLPVVLSLYIAVRVLEALAYAHRKKDQSGLDLGLVHRDVSPQNILVSYEGEVKVIDFGLARSKLSLGRSQPQAVLGKLYYMPPEQARGDAVDRRSDLYAVGVVLYELLAGQNPFEDAPQDQLFSRICAPRIQPIQELEPSLPQGVVDVLARALAPDPEARFRTAEQMRAALSACLSELAPDVGPEQLATYVVTLFTEEHQREREVLARFALGSAEEGESFPTPSPGGSHDETQPVSDPRPPPVSHGNADGEQPAAPPQFSSPTSRFADPTPATRADDAPAHLAAPTLRGSGLPDVPWDRRASGTRALVSATAPVAGPATRPWFEVESEEDRLHRMRVGGETRRRSEEEPTPAAPGDAAAQRREKTETSAPGGSAAHSSSVPAVSMPAAAAAPFDPPAPEQAHASASPHAPGQAHVSSSPQGPLQDDAVAREPRRLGAPTASTPAEARSNAGAEKRRGRRSLYLAILLLVFVGAGVAHWLTMPGAIEVDTIVEPAPVAVEPAPPPVPDPQPELEVPEPPVEEPPPPPVARPAPAPPPPAPVPAAPPPPPVQEERVVEQPAPEPPPPPIDRRQALIRRREALERSFSSLVAEHGAGQIGTIVIELERAVGSSFDRFIDSPEQYDSLERQLGELEQILDERRRAFR